MESLSTEPKVSSVRPAAAVLIGAAIGNSLSYAVLFVLGLFFLWVLVAQGIPGNDAFARAYESTRYLVFAHLVGFLCLVPGGLWAARLSETSHIRNATLAGLLVAGFALLGNLVPYYLPIPLWSRVASVLLPVPAFVVGAVLQRRAA
jgi:hypothetical protein